MAVFRPNYRDKKSGEVKRTQVWWFEFTYAGKRVRESAKTTRKTVAIEAEKQRRKELEMALAGVPVERRESRILSVSDVVKPYLVRYELDHRERRQSILSAKSRLAHVLRLLGSTLVVDLSEDAMRTYIATRLAEGVSGRTCNMEVGELSRAIGKPWSTLWPRLRRQEERRDVGQALAPDQERRLLDAASSRTRWQIAACMIRVALLTGMRIGEILSLTWGQIDFARRVVTVGRAKSTAGTGRQLPMNADLFALLSTHATWYAARFRQAEPGLFLFPAGKPAPTDPTRPTTTLKTVWKSIRKAAGVNCRLHDMRHTVATKMAEAGVPESTMLAIMGHMSRAMLERYSHIRMAAKRAAMDALASPKTAQISDGVPQVSPLVAVSAKVQ